MIRIKHEVMMNKHKMLSKKTLMIRKWFKIYQRCLTLVGSVRRLNFVNIVKSRSLRKSIQPARIRSNLPAKYVENFLQAVIHFRFIINTQNHSINQFTRKFLVDGRSTSQALETETLVFVIFVWFTSKCSFTTGFEVIKFAQLLHTFDSLV